MTSKQQSTIKDSSKLSDKQYTPDDYNKQDELSKGFAVTHEQVSDTYTEGTVDGAIEQTNGKAQKLERKGYSI